MAAALFRGVRILTSWRTVLRRWGRRFAIVVLLVACVVGGAVWLAGREAALRWAADRAVAASAGRLVLEGVQGSLYGPLRVSRVVYEDDKVRVEARGVELDWTPWMLSRQRIALTRLAVASLDWNSKSAEPPTLPQTLRLPLALQLGQGSVGVLRYRNPDNTVQVSKLAFGLRGDAAGYHLDALTAETPWGWLRGALQLEAQAPFALRGRVALQGREQPPLAAQATLAGRLAEIDVAASATLGRIEASASAVATPFDKTPWKRAELTARHVDPAQWRKGLARGDFTLALALQMQADGSLRGKLEASNAMPGSLDRDRWPLRKLGAELSGEFADLRLHGIELDLGEAGRFSGSGSVRGSAVALDLATGDFDLKGVHGKLKPTRLSGSIRLGLQGAAQTLRADLQQQRYRIRINAVHRDGSVEVRTASVAAAGSELSFSGAVALSGARDFRAAGNLRRFDPAQFGDFPHALINAAFSATGRLAPEPQAALKLTVADSRFRGQPLSGTGQLQLSARRVWGSDIALALGASRFGARGAFGAPGDRLDWDIAVADMAVIGPDFAGRGTASGTLEGTPGNPSGTFSASARQLRWGADDRLASLRASGTLAQGLDGMLALNAELAGYRHGKLALDHASVTARGRRASHELSIAADGPDLDAHADLAGGWEEKSGWSGSLRTLENRGRYPLALLAPARLTLAPGRFSLNEAALGFAGANIQIHELSRQGGRLSSRGELRGLPLDQFAVLAFKPRTAETNLTLAGKWSVAVADRVDGSIELWREQGDVTMLTTPRTPLGLKQLLLRVTALDSHLNGRLEVAGTTLGNLAADGASTLTYRNGAWGIAGDAPLRGAVKADMPSLAWTGLLLGNGVSVGGSLAATFNAAGTLAAPRFNGEIDAQGLQLSFPAYGVQLSEGRLQAQLRDDTLLVKSLTLRGGDGSLSGKGFAGLKNGVPVLQIALNADKLQALGRPDRHLVVSGTSEIAVQERRVRVSGNLKADQASIELTKGDAPALSPDVVVLGRPTKAGKKGLPYALVLDMDFDLGERFRLKGRGLDARLAGAVKVRSRDGGMPTATGSIRVAEGSYAAYGQRLVIERGIVNFSGAIDDPALNIVALRKNQPVEAGVAIGGSALAPRITLVSNPTVPDSEKLSWLVLGHGLDTTSGAEFSLLQTAAGALLARGESATLETRIAHAAGLDEVALSGSGGLESTVLTLGKRLSSSAYLSFEQGLTGASNLVKINYTLTPRFSVRAQTGTDSAVDLFYTFSFD